MSKDMEKIMYITKNASYAVNAIVMLAIIIIQITNNANPISIAILSFLYGAYVMIVFVILYEEHLEKEYECAYETRSSTTRTSTTTRTR